MNGCWNGSRVNCMRNYSLPSGHLCLLHSISSAISDGSKSRGSKAITFSSVIPSSRLSFPSFASIYISISSTSFPSRFDHSPISSRDHDRAYFVLEIQMVPHFFFFATNGLLGAIDPRHKRTPEFTQPFSLLVHQDRLDSDTSPFLPFAAQKTTAFKPTCAGLENRFLRWVDVQKE